MNERKLCRMENKKRKLKAYLDLAESNIQARLEKERSKKKKEESTKKKKDRFMKYPSKPKNIKNHDVSLKSLFYGNHLTSFEKENLKFSARKTAKGYGSLVQSPVERRKRAKTNGTTTEGDPQQPEEEKPNRLTDDEFQLLKLRLRAVEKLKKQWPLMFFNKTGHAALTSVRGQERVPLFVQDLQTFFLYSAISTLAPYKPRWSEMRRMGKISQIVIIIVEGISVDDLCCPKAYKFASYDNNNNYKHTTNTEKTQELQTLEDDVKTLLPRATSFLKHQLEFIAPSQYGCKFIEEFIYVLVNHRMTQRLQEENCYEKFIKNRVITRYVAPVIPMLQQKDPKPEATQEDVELPESDKFDRRLLMLNNMDLVKFKFPLKMNMERNFKPTRKVYAPVTAKSPMFGVDCEMCLTTLRQNELTSVSVVNENGELVYHSLVKPPNPIIDYLTQYSGITKAMLRNVKKTLQEVQTELSAVLPADAILVGHSLDGDLKTLKLVHPYCIDSSLIYNLSGNRKVRSGLKTLTLRYRGEVIQDRGMDGHDPTEDAMASLKLVQLKLSKSLEFGDVICEALSDSLSRKFDQTEHVVKAQNFVANLFQYMSLQDGDRKSSFFYTQSCDLENENILQLSTGKCKIEMLEKNKRVVDAMVQEMPTNYLVIGHLNLNKIHSPGKSKQEVLQNLDRKIKRVFNATKDKALFSVILTGSPLSIPKEKRSGGLFLMDLKGEPAKQI